MTVKSLESPARAVAKPATTIPELFLLSANATPALAARARTLADRLAREPSLSLIDVAFSLMSDLSPAPRRLAIVASSHSELIERLSFAADRLDDSRCVQIRDSRGVYHVAEPLGADGGVAFLFPGEGAQYLGMLTELCERFPAARAVVDRFDAQAAAHGERPIALRRLVLFPPDASADDRAAAEREMRSIRAAMFSVLVADWVFFELLTRLGVAPRAMAGHSMGELGALLAADAVDGEKFSPARIMEVLEGFEAREEATDSADAVLLAVGAGREALQALIEPYAEEGVYLGMDNCPHQTVVVGRAEPMNRLAADLSRRQMMVERLPFARPYHTPLFESELPRFDQMFEGVPFRSPRVPVYSCTTAAPFPSDGKQARALAVAHWASPVRFREMIERMQKDGIRLFVETGPRGNLSAFVEDILRGQTFAALPVNVPRRGGVAQLLHLVGQLFAHHVVLNPAVLFEGRGSQWVNLFDQPQASPPQAALAPSPSSGPAPLPLSKGLSRSAVVAKYFSVMEQMLDVERAVVGQFLARAPRGGRKLSRRAAPPRPVVSKLAPSTPTPSPRPLLGRVVELKPGERIVTRRVMDLAEDRFVAAHTVGGRKISKVDPSQCGLPVMPMTGTLEMMAEVAEALTPNKTVLGIENVKLYAWLDYDDATPHEVETVATRAESDPRRPGVDRVDLVVRDLRPGEKGRPRPPVAEGTVLLAARRPAAPLAGPFTLTNPRPCPLSVESLYRNLFHGDPFQGVLSVDQLGEEGCEAMLETQPRDRALRSNPAPDWIFDPVLADTAMHPLAAWHLEKADQTGRMLLPFELKQIEVFGSPPPAGTRLLCRSLVTTGTARYFSHDYDVITPDGRVWLRMRGARNWRFYVPFAKVNFHGPKDEYFLCQRWEEATEALKAAGFPRDLRVLRFEPPIDLKQPTIRGVAARVTLSRDEFNQFNRLCADPASSIDPNQWLFGRLVAKDAVRALVADLTGEKLFIADVEIADDGGGVRATSRGGEGPILPGVAFAVTESLFIGVAANISRVGVGQAQAEDEGAHQVAKAAAISQLGGQADDAIVVVARVGESVLAVAAPRRDA